MRQVVPLSLNTSQIQAGSAALSVAAFSIEAGRSLTLTMNAQVGIFQLA